MVRRMGLEEDASADGARPATAWWRRPTPGSANARISRVPRSILDTHIQDILNVIKFEDLDDIVLLGHSYGGMVANRCCRPRARARGAADLSRRLRAA
jgi:pimeloyl-ACP methyl ester carboxylesterase